MSPKKLIPLIVTNDDKNVKLIVDKSSIKAKLRKDLENEESMKYSNITSDDGMTGDEESVAQNFDFTLKTNTADNYFTAQSVRSKSSNSSFSKVMENFDLNETEIKEIIDKQLVPQRKQLLDEYKKDNFEKWINLLNCGFNILLHGIGSKHKLIDNFVDNCLQSHHHFVIHGYKNDISLKQIISVFNQMINHSFTDENKLINCLEDIDFDFYLIIHSIDLLCANNQKIKLFLNQLVLKCKTLHIISSVDHINSGLIWSSNESNAYHWLWFNVPTFEPYIIEKAFSNNKSMISTSSHNWDQSMTLSSVKHVYDSLTSNAQQIFLLILNQFIDNEEVVKNGFPFSDCYLLCREQFLVNSETTLRAQLSEFKDHKLLKLKRGPDGGRVIHVCIDKSVAKKFVEQNK